MHVCVPVRRVRCCLFTSITRESTTEYIYVMQVAKLTHQISVFTEGVMMMKSTLMGTSKVWQHEKEKCLYFVVEGG